MPAGDIDRVDPKRLHDSMLSEKLMTLIRHVDLEKCCGHTCEVKES